MSEINKKIILSFDVELWSEGEWLKPYITPDMMKIDTFPSSIENILDLIRGKGFATFFVTLTVTEKYPDIIKKISDDGHEIGIHGPKHKKLKYYDPQDFKTDCIKQIDLIKKITGKKPLGYRAPHFSLNKETGWVLPILKELGFIYDSSIFPINLGEYGVSRSITEPNEIIPGFKEIPITVAEIFGLRIPFAGGIYFRILPYFIFKKLLNYTIREKISMLYFHPHELDKLTPKIKKGPFIKRLLKYFGINNSFKKFNNVLDYYKFNSIENTFIKN